ncbi:hypothetical protein [Terriglobus roseus]|uniref:Uncharacterized protein n=1 Tax=Terriglobus roseus TaxID=392734 RepID=A0A1H4LK57_9BACT|nr:hypothetical protein [Terriglobus roseus]SEB70926.1 hypothetical protein SAMN05443244_1622 [Terriglobus roseus]
MHAANNYLYGIGKAVRQAVIDNSEAQALGLFLLADANDYFQSAAVTFFDALRGIELGYFSWATVKLYFVFYSLRARLALNRECIFYAGHSPLALEASDNASPVKLSGTTHKAVISRFSSRFPNDYFLSQDIGGKPPLDWLMALREDANYRNSRFSEPVAPSHLTFAATNDLRKVLTAYTTDDVYVFDEQHAIVAYPFKMLKALRQAMPSAPLAFNEADFLRQSLRDHEGNQATLECLLI